MRGATCGGASCTPRCRRAVCGRSMAGRQDLVAELLALATDDAVAVRALLDVDFVTDSILAFHAQQAVEKSLTAVLASRQIHFPFTHDIARLVELCESVGVALPAQISDVDRLTAVRRAVPLRVGGRR